MASIIDDIHISISPGNSKMGAIPSVSLPSIVTCPVCSCRTKCYANKIEKLRPSVKSAYEKNYNILLSDKEKYWREVEAAIMLSRYFRFHVSGDIPDEDYLMRMIDVSSRHPTCEILCFTKRYEFVANATKTLGGLPSNLHIILSGWVGLEMFNPFNLPEAHVMFKDGTTTASGESNFCPGNCSECAVTGEGCWVLKNGQQIIFKEH